MSRTPVFVVSLFFAAASPAQGPVAKVQVSSVVEHEFRPSVELLGEVEAIRRVDLGARIDGRVAELRFDEGLAVAAAAPLLVLETKSREIRLRGAKARLRAATEQLSEYRNGSRPEEIAKARTAVNEARALLEEAEEDLERERGKQKSEIGSKKDLAIATARVGARRAILAGLEAQLTLIQQGPRKEQIERAAADVELRKSEVAAIEDEIAKATVRAPFAGVVTQKPVEVGAYVRAGTNVCSLVQLDPIRVSVGVAESRLAHVKVGSEIALSFDAFPGERFVGKVRSVVPNADRLARSFPVKIDLANPKGRLLPGMSARVALPSGDGKASLGVPRDAVVRSARGSVVWKVEGNVVSPVPVKVGLGDGPLIAVSGALEKGDRVAVRGNEGLRPGQKVVVVGGKR